MYGYADSVLPNTAGSESSDNFHPGGQS